MMLPLRMELAMTFKAFFPNGWPAGRIGQVCPWPREAVSGRNILICPADATLFRPFLTGYRPSRAGHRQPRAGFGFGNLRAWALCSAKEAGTENWPVWVS